MKIKPFSINLEYCINRVRMFLFEFNNLDLEDKRAFLFGRDRDNNIRFSCIRDDGDYKYTLWNCGDFFVEMCALNGKLVKIEGFELTDDRINLYIDWVREHEDDPKYQLE